MRAYRLIVIVGALAFLSSAAKAGALVPDFVKPVGVVAVSDEYDGTRKAVYSMDGSGLDASGQHTNSVSGTMWMTHPVSSAWIEYDLGAPVPLSGLHLWNHNQNNYTNRGIKDASISTSLDGSTWSSPVAMTFMQADSSSTYPGEDYSFPQTLDARYVRIDGLNTFGGTSNYYGLAEVRFTTPMRIDGVTATASSEYSVRTADKTIDDSGMSGFGLERGDTNPNNMWLTNLGNIVGRTITFDLQDVYPVGAMRVWNYNQVAGTDYSFRGIKEFDVEVSLDNSTWETLSGPLAGGHFGLTRATGAADYLAADMIDLGKTIAQYVRLTVVDYYGTNPASDYVGLSEVRFYQAVPEPAAFVLAALGLLGLAFFGRRRKR